MKILVVGIGSVLAQRVALHLRERKHQVLGLDRRKWLDAPRDIEVFTADIGKRAAEDVFRVHRPECVVHMATVNALSARLDERARINVGGTKAVFSYSLSHGVKHVVFVGRHTFYGVGADAPLYRTENEPPHGIGTFPELADLVAADMYAANTLWREPALKTTVLRLVYTLGPSLQGTLASFLRGRRVPTVFGFDPLFQFLQESDAAHAIALSAEKGVSGVFNVEGPQPLPLSLVIRQVDRTAVPLPEGVLRRLLGRFGLPSLPKGAVEHLKYPIVVDGAAFRKATGFQHAFDEVETLAQFKALLSQHT
jgi:UDP-glucose 4-epimerase